MSFAAGSFSGKTKNNRRILIIRHAQRVDRYLREAYPNINPKDWTKECCPNSKYNQLNLEMPLYLPARTPMSLYNRDPPLTTMGESCSQLLGSRLAEIGFHIDLVYSSPALRCIQTAHRILTGYTNFIGENDLRIRIEAGLYEFGGFSSEGVPESFCDAEFFTQKGILVDSSYTSTMPPKELFHFQLTEEYTEYKKRSKSCINHLINVAGRGYENIAFVTHAPTLVSFTRLLINKPLIVDNLHDEINKITNKPAYLSTILLEENASNRVWSVAKLQPVQNFEIRAIPSFNQTWLNKTSYV